MGYAVEKAECLALVKPCENPEISGDSTTYTNVLIFDSSRYSWLSSFRMRVISVPWVWSVLPRGSGYTSKEVASEELAKTCWMGLGFSFVAGGSEATYTSDATRKLEKLLD